MLHDRMSAGIRKALIGFGAGIVLLVYLAIVFAVTKAALSYLATGSLW